MTEEKQNKKSAASKSRKKTASAKPKGSKLEIPATTRFEDALQELETIVEALESGDQPLEDSLAQFERGIGLARFCQKSLADAEQKVMILTGDGDESGDPGDENEDNGLEPFELDGEER